MNTTIFSRLVRVLGGAALAITVSSGSASAGPAQFVIVNLNLPGVGFNDPTIREFGLTTVWKADLPQIRGTHLHPKDTGGTLLTTAFGTHGVIADMNGDGIQDVARVTTLNFPEHIENLRKRSLRIADHERAHASDSTRLLLTSACLAACRGERYVGHPA